MNAVTPIEAENPRVAIGDNKPPELTPFETVKLHIDDLLVEAHNWADGTVVESQAQADEASRLIDDLRRAARAAEDLRVVEKKPFDDALDEIQGRYNPLIADPKTKNPGKVWKAIDALKATVKPFLDRLEEERRAAAEKARLEAQAAADRAAEAARAARASDLAAQEQAEQLVREANEAARAASRIENSRTQARGGARAMGLRTTWTPVMTDPRAALGHYASTRRDAVIAFLQGLAEADVRDGKRAIPGFDIQKGTAL